MPQKNAWVDSAAPLRACEQLDAAENWREWVPGEPPRPGPTPDIDEALAQSETPTGPTSPQPHVSMPEEPLPVEPRDAGPALWVVGAHGGSGESTLAEIVEKWAAAGHCWPKLPSAERAACIVVARTNVRGLLAARAALTQWAASGAGDSVELLGLVLVADAPGKLPAPIRDLAKVVGGGAPRVWSVPWVEAWRLGDPVTERAPRAVSKLVSTLRSLAASSLDDAVPSNLEEKS